MNNNQDVFLGMNSSIAKIFLWCLLLACLFSASRAQQKQNFKVIAFFTAKNDRAHISFVHEANRWFATAATKYHFTYDSTDNWDNLNTSFLSHYQVVLFLDTRPESEPQRTAFKQYMDNGGAWMGFHFAGFALTNSTYPQNWPWYHDEFIGAGEYKGNTWRPTGAVLRVEDRKHPATRHLPATFISAPNEWYSWKNDLAKNPSIKILLSIDTTSFPLGTGPKPHEIWHSGYYPISWANTKYKMIYVNMGHDDIDYENKTNRQLSSTFGSETQCKFIMNALLWLGKGTGILTD
jgi:uncharacterized protein